MLVSFSVSNFRSFHEEQTFSLVASKRHTGVHEKHALPIPHSDESVLRAGVIYGANGAGKSNLFKAVRFLRHMVLDTRDKEGGVPIEPFLLERSGGPSNFDLQFVSGGTLYRYGFKLTNVQVQEEWLVRIIDEKEKIVFERTTTEDGDVSVELGEDGSNGSQFDKFKNLAKVGGPRNQTFLATVVSTLDALNWPPWVRDAILWFFQLQTVDPGDPTRRLPVAFIDDDGLVSFAGQFLNAAATGIDSLQMTQTPLSEDEISRLPASFREGKRGRHYQANGDVIFAERTTEKVQYSVAQLKAAHRDQNGGTVPFDIKQESDGTKRILDLLPALHTSQKLPLCYFIDEIDRSLHPILAREFLEFFFKSCENSSAQLIMTTHESSLLDQELLRRDEIWFAEKDPQGATKLYSLLDFTPRNDLDLRKNYLQGRFGAIPFLGGMERLLEKRQHPTGAKPE